MKTFMTPAFRISLGLAGLAFSFVATAFVFGFLPNEREIRLDSRIDFAESLAIQVASTATKDGPETLYDMFSLIVERNDDVLGLNLRKSDGLAVLTVGNRDSYWAENINSLLSTETHVRVPIFDQTKKWGQLEITFAELEPVGTVLGFPTPIAKFLAVFGVFALAGFYITIRRALRVLDPGSVVPKRVQSAFDTLVEGIVIVDNREHVLLANEAFCRNVDETPDSLIGRKISDFKWRQWSTDEAVAEFPWRLAIRDNNTAESVQMSLRDSSLDILNFSVNASSINDGSGSTSGAIITFDNVTTLLQKKEELVQTIGALEKNEEKILRQNGELLYLAQHDPLTGCLNRRTLFEKFDTMFESARQNSTTLYCMMVDLDHFKSINDRFGHATGDDVIAGMAEILKISCEQHDLVGRYGGEEYCVVLEGYSPSKVKTLTDNIRMELEQRSPCWLKKDEHITASIGVAALFNGVHTPLDLIKLADAALYEAKENGRDRVEYWDRSQTPPVTPADSVDAPETPVAEERRQEVSATIGTRKDDVTWTEESAIVIDPGTNLPPKEEFFGRLEQAMAHANRRDQKIAVLHVSIDSVQQLLDTFGKQICDELVSKAGGRLSSILRETDTVSQIAGNAHGSTISHLEGGGFAVLLTDLSEISAVTWVIKRLLAGAAKPIQIKNNEIYSKLFVGASLYPGDGDTTEDLIKNARIASRHARESHKDTRYAFYSKSINEASRKQVLMETWLRTAIKHDQFSLRYQPIMNVNSGDVVCVEALLCCEHTNLRELPLSMVIEVAEQSGLIDKIGEWVTERSVKQLKAWDDAGLKLPLLSLNMSAVQLRNIKTVEKTARIVKELGLNPNRIQIEITETSLIEDISNASRSLKRLQQMGFHIALDDFGTGNASLRYLQKIKADTLKIDHCFIDGIESNTASRVLVSAIIAMSKELGMKVVAEGVETRPQLEALKSLGCDEIQGYILSRPMPARAASEWLRIFAKSRTAAKNTSAPIDQTASNK